MLLMQMYEAFPFDHLLCSLLAVTYVQVVKCSPGMEFHSTVLKREDYDMVGDVNWVRCCCFACSGNLELIAAF
jgi:hypothetical protein